MSAIIDVVAQSIEKLCNWSNALFSTRELAVIIWGLIFFVYMMSHKDIRQSLNGLLIAFIKLVFHPVGIFTIFYIGFIFLVLFINNLIGTEIIKDYIVWILFGLFPMISKAVSEYHTTNIFNLLFITVKLSLIPIFIINEYTFSLLIELFFVPIISLVTMLSAFSDTDPKYSQVKKVFDFLLAVFGFIILYYSFKIFVLNISDIKQIVFWQKMLMDIAGALLHVPLLFTIQMFSFYENLIIRTKITSKKDKFLAALFICKKFLSSKERLIKNWARIPFYHVKSAEDLKGELSNVLDNQRFTQDC